jgi:xanthine dehydrogenase iron-sulfur cluster and FAD-binding subunit A
MSKPRPASLFLKKRALQPFYDEDEKMISITVNGIRRDLDVPPDMPLLWVIRDELNMTGTKFGCGVS